MTGGQPSMTYSPGLEGVIAGETAICQVDPNAGLLYRGYDVHELAPNVPFEDVVWLLFYGDLPTPEQSEILRARLAAEYALPAGVTEALRLFPPQAPPTDVLRTGVSMLAAFDADLNDHSHAAKVFRAHRQVYNHVHWIVEANGDSGIEYRLAVDEIHDAIGDP